MVIDLWSLKRQGELSDDRFREKSAVGEHNWNFVLEMRIGVLGSLVRSSPKECHLEGWNTSRWTISRR